MHEYFGGWYFKSQSKTQTLAVIVAGHIHEGKPSASIQIINDEGAWNLPFPAEEYRVEQDGFTTSVGENKFGTGGLTLSVDAPECKVEGKLTFGKFTPLRYDIMGPFRFVPFMECRHAVKSLWHTVSGSVTVNGVEYRFENDNGYIEGDRGRSFPSEYLWTHCNFGEEGHDSLMLSVANIPFGLFHFTGLLCAIWHGGKEYRLATYLGARATHIGNNAAVVRQGDCELIVKLIEKKAHPLYAPTNGAMVRTIRESASCRAFYRFRKGGKTLFSFISDRASFEYEYQK